MLFLRNHYCINHQVMSKITLLLHLQPLIWITHHYTTALPWPIHNPIVMRLEDNQFTFEIMSQPCKRTIQIDFESESFNHHETYQRPEQSSLGHNCSKTTISTPTPSSTQQWLIHHNSNTKRLWPQTKPKALVQASPL